MLDDRKLEVLRAIVEDYVSTQEPVGSKSLVERHHLGVSPATIRNDMATLEEEGYIAQPHTSAGRVPTDKGYRLFVDKLSAVKPLSAAERRAIQTFLEGAVDLDDVVRRTVRLLAQITHQVAVVQYPILARSAVRHVEVVQLSVSRLLLVLITDTGRVEQRVVELPAPADPETVSGLRHKLNERMVGRLLAEASSRIATLPDEVEAEQRGLVSVIVSTIVETLVEHREDRVELAGTANLARFNPDFGQSFRPVLEALEEHVTLLKLLGEAADPTAVSVRIGEENPEGLQATSVVSTAYGAEDRTFASLAVLGPTRMDYPGTMAAVRAVARYVGRILAQG